MSLTCFIFSFTNVLISLPCYTNLRMQVNKTTWIIFCSVECIHWGLTWPCDNCRLCYSKYFFCKSHVRSSRVGRTELFHKSRNCSSVMHKMNFVVGLYFQGMPTQDTEVTVVIPVFLAACSLANRSGGCWAADQWGGAISGDSGDGSWPGWGQTRGGHIYTRQPRHN